MSRIETSFTDGVFHIELSRPEARNPMDNEFFREMRDAFTSAEENPEVRVVLISGRGEGICSGADLKALRKDRGVLTGDSVSWPGNLMALTMALMTKPIVAAVHGVAFGGGVTMLLYCDFVVAAEGTRFCTPFSRLGLCTELGSSLLLPLAVGMRKAKEWALLGEVFEASEALEAGFVNAVVPRDELMERAGKYLSKLKDACPSSLRAIKRLMIEAHLGVLTQTLIREYEALDKGLNSPEFTEALEAFAEKRKPDFRRFS
jgi:enoyl-CoA hydratase/carnithine racemase